MKWFKQNAANQVGSQHPDYNLPGLTTMDCITYVIKCISHAYEKSGERDVADAVTGDPMHLEDGGYLGQFLVKNGWVAHYWNPDVRHPRDPSEKYKGGDPEHPDSYRIAKKFGKYTSGVPGDSDYWEIKPVSSFIINYRPTTSSEYGVWGSKIADPTRQDLTGLLQLKKRHSLMASQKVPIIPLWFLSVNFGKCIGIKKELAFIGMYRRPSRDLVFYQACCYSHRRALR